MITKLSIHEDQLNECVDAVIRRWAEFYGVEFSIEAGETLKKMLIGELPAVALSSTENQWTFE
jgi:hypothetical protein